MMRSPSEIRAEIAKWQALAAIRRPHRSLESLVAASMIQALTWALGDEALSCAPSAMVTPTEKETPK